MIGRSDVEAAWRLIQPHVRRTPALELPAGSLGVRAPVALKLESLQVSGSFKGRGAFHKLLASTVPAAGIIAASGGNHGAAAAYAARALGHKAEIFVPTIASPTKVARLKSYGAIVHQIGAVYAEARAASEKRAAETGALIVPAYEDEVVFAGAGSVALEFAEQARFDTLLVAVGGGGLIAGCASAIGEGTRIVAVETEGTPTLHEALRAGHPVEVKISGIAADALGASLIGTPNFEVARKLVARVRAGERRSRPQSPARLVGRASRDRRACGRHRARRPDDRRLSAGGRRACRHADLRRQHRARLGRLAPRIRSSA